ncbi:hypothetical protein [Actinomadura sp. NTSP31]|uniref:hypothetical protein n=1 Tax=Actinomadura sp. NTSP31 TaxID=1735447 RepID=UPI0035BFE66F
MRMLLWRCLPQAAGALSYRRTSWRSAPAAGSEKSGIGVLGVSDSKIEKLSNTDSYAYSRI